MFGNVWGTLRASSQRRRGKKEEGGRGGVQKTQKNTRGMQTERRKEGEGEKGARGVTSRSESYGLVTLSLLPRARSRAQQT